MAPYVHPYHVEQHLKQVKRDIVVLEAQVEALKVSGEQPSKPWRQTSKFMKPLKSDGLTKSANSKQSDKTKPKNEDAPKKERKAEKMPLTARNENEIAVGVCRCPTEGPPCIGQVSTRICSKNHVHHTIRIPASTVMPAPPQCHKSSGVSSQRTWREALQKQTSRKENLEGKKQKPATASTNRMKEGNKELLSEQLEMLQKEVRSAKEEKNRAQREAILAKLALGKYETIVESQIATRDNHFKSLQLMENRIKALIEKERQEVEAKINEEIAHWRSVNTSPRTSGSSSSSQRFRTSSPTRSVDSNPDSPSSWHDLSAIQSRSFRTVADASNVPPITTSHQAALT